MYRLALTFGPADRLHLLSPGVYWANKKISLAQPYWPAQRRSGQAGWRSVRVAVEGEGKGGRERAGEGGKLQRTHAANVLLSLLLIRS